MLRSRRTGRQRVHVAGGVATCSISLTKRHSLHVRTRMAWIPTSVNSFRRRDSAIESLLIIFPSVFEMPVVQLISFDSSRERFRGGDRYDADVIKFSLSHLSLEAPGPLRTAVLRARGPA